MMDNLNYIQCVKMSFKLDILYLYYSSVLSIFILNLSLELISDLLVSEDFCTKIFCGLKLKFLQDENLSFLLI